MKTNRVSFSDETMEELKPHAEPFESVDDCVKRLAKEANNGNRSCNHTTENTEEPTQKPTEDPVNAES